MKKSSLLRRRRMLQLVAGAGTGSALGPPVSVQTAGGDLIWAFQTGAEVWSSPTVVDGTVFVGSQDSHVYALDAASGDKQWAFETGAEVWSSPTVVDGTVFVGSTDSHVYALDATTGERQWAVTTGSEVVSSPTVVDGTVFVGSTDSHVYALDATTGDRQWAVTTGSGVISSPTVVDGTVFIGNIGTAEGHVYALDAATGDQQWTVETGSGVYSSPTVVDGTVFVGSDDNHVYALDTASGDQQWAFDTEGPVFSSPTVVNGTVFIGSPGEGDYLYVLDAATGDQQWAVTAVDQVASSPTVANGTVFVGGGDQYIYALDTSTGDQQWTFETEAEVVSSPTVVDGTVFVGSYDSHVYALDAGVPGSSEGSRVRLGTLGHHDGYSDGPEINGAIVEFNPASGAVSPDEEMASTVTVENTGGTDHTFFVSYSIVGPNDGIYHEEDETGTAIELEPGEQATVELSWSVPASASTGPYDVLVVLWEESDRDALETRLDEAEEEAAFELEEGDSDRFTNLKEEKRERAARIDEISTAELEDRAEVEEILDSLTGAVETGSLQRETAAEATYRMRMAEQIVDDTLTVVGPGENPLTGQDDYNLAESTSVMSLQTATSIAFASLELSDALEHYLDALSETSMPYVGPRTVEAAVESAIDFLDDGIDMVIQWAVERTTLDTDPKQDTRAAASDVQNTVSDAGLTTGEAVADAIGDAISSIVDRLADQLRHHVELGDELMTLTVEHEGPEPVEDVLIPKRGPVGVEPALGLLHEQTAPELIEGNDGELYGDSDGAETAYSEGKNAVNHHADSTQTWVEAFDAGSDEISLLQSILDLQDAVSDGTLLGIGRQLIGVAVAIKTTIVAPIVDLAGSARGTLGIDLLRQNAVESVIGITLGNPNIDFTIDPDVRPNGGLDDISDEECVKVSNNGTLQLENSNCFVRMDEDALESYKIRIATAIGDADGTDVAGPIITHPRSSNGPPELESTEAFEITDETGLVGGYRTIRSYMTVAGTTLQVIADVSLTGKDEFVLVDYEFKNTGDASVELDHPPSNIHTGLHLSESISLVDRTGEEDDYRFHIPGDGTQRFMDTSKWTTFSGTNYGTIFDDDDAVTHGLIVGDSEPRMWIEEDDHLDYLMNPVTLSPDEAVAYTVFYAVHEGGDEAPSIGEEIYDVASARAAGELPDIDC